MPVALNQATAGSVRYAAASAPQIGEAIISRSL
ncbi:hypothetical protein X769_30730 [Mesorhizobium sp. LSJC268A00]|nr:hypothetical protein X769_30730 [Mesorhizobium sp. LSJC268A00]ESZ06228.1 hypothetical protein X735_31890 [Mesorhizobium sp. L2C085B000]